MSPYLWKEIYAQTMTCGANVNFRSCGNSTRQRNVFLVFQKPSQVWTILSPLLLNTILDKIGINANLSITPGYRKPTRPLCSHLRFTSHFNILDSGLRLMRPINPLDAEIKCMHAKLKFQWMHIANLKNLSKRKNFSDERRYCAS